LLDEGRGDGRWWDHSTQTDRKDCNKRLECTEGRVAYQVVNSLLDEGRGIRRGLAPHIIVLLLLTLVVHEVGGAEELGHEGPILSGGLGNACLGWCMVEAIRCMMDSENWKSGRRGLKTRASRNSNLVFTCHVYKR
jgi:hypothetical protein